ncbi:RnfH family protein [Bordetella genomosp. 11]|nr:RnfH family protein [Bordetella genomosp. 11]
MLTVWVYYAHPRQAWSRRLQLPAGATVGDAVAACGFAQAFPDIDPWATGVGVFGRIVPASRPLVDGDRVEIYRALVFDPMDSRRRRAAHRARKSFAARPPRTPKAAR